MRAATKAGSIALVAAVAIGGAVAIATRSDDGGNAQAATPTSAPRVTAKVTRRNLVATTAVGGTLTFGTAHAIRVSSSSSSASSSRAATSAATAIITALPTLGSIVKRGDSLFEMNGGPGPALLYGSRPMWRTLVNGVSDGVDVLQLEANLAALGYTDGGAMVVDSHFTLATGTAIAAWQADRGLTKTGSIAPGDVVYDSGPVRVSAHTAAIGDAATGSIYNVTGTTRSIHVDLDPANQAYVTEHGHVTVTLPDGNNVVGIVSSIGTVATVTSSGGNGGGQTTSTIPVTITLKTEPTGALDDSPVTINLVTSRARNVLAVPVNALLALAEGGYALEKVNADGTTTLVAVTPGKFANGFVEITGNLSEGETVVSA